MFFWRFILIFSIFAFLLSGVMTWQQGLIGSIITSICVEFFIGWHKHMRDHDRDWKAKMEEAGIEHTVGGGWRVGNGTNGNSHDKED